MLKRFFKKSRTDVTELEYVKELISSMERDSILWVTNMCAYRLDRVKKQLTLLHAYSFEKSTWKDKHKRRSEIFRQLGWKVKSLV